MLRGKNAIQRANGFASEALTLRTPRGRLAVFVVLSLAVFVSEYAWLENLSFWKLVGWESAPSIGLTRAYWLFLHGDISGAWERNSMIFLVLAVGFVLISHDVSTVIRRKIGTN